MSTWCALLLLALMDPTVGGHVSEGDPLSTVVFPEQRITIDFHHAIHVEEVGLGCRDCHDGVATSQTTKDYNVPARATCLECHDDVEIPARWGRRWRSPDNGVALPPGHVRFPHARHVDLEGVTCATCHAGVETARLATRDHLPSMETCLTCHDGRQASGDCRTCHVTGAGGRLRTVFPEGLLVPDDHGPHFLRQHEVDAERDLEYCASCHAREECLSCHDGALPPRFHDGDYLAMHSQDALANSPPCASCHRLESFCHDCHFRAQVTWGNPLFPTLEGSFHPPGWGAWPPDQPEHHSYVARKNLAACASCHVPERDCLGCHGFFDGAARTHGAGWADSDRMRRLMRENIDLCYKCHGFGEPGDPVPRP